jgi:hypothetical protein
MKSSNLFYHFVVRKCFIPLLLIVFSETISLNPLQAQSFGGSTISNNSFYVSSSTGDIALRRHSAGETKWKRTLVGMNNSLLINFGGDFTSGVEIQSALRVKGILRAPEITVALADISTLKVNGDMHANNIRIATNGQTADFVFESGYNLRSLQELESFIIENKHLPEIPSAADMDSNGVDLAEMNKLLLMKIEELTLYVIEQQKAIEELRDKQ